MAAIIFDFDGTIVDSFDYVADFLAGEAGIAPLTSAQKQEMRGISMVAMARLLGHRWWRLPGLLLRGRRTMTRVIKKLQPFEDIPSVIEKLHAEGHELFILTSNTVHNVHVFLRQHQLETYFLEVYGGIGLFGKSGAIRRLLKEQNLKVDDALYVGDEVRDVEAAQSIGLRIIAVTWGFARPSDLDALQPTAIAEEPSDLVQIIEEL